MGGQWDSTIGVAGGTVSPPADIDRYAVVVGVLSSGLTGLRGPFLSAAAIVAAVGYGDAVDVAGQVCEQRQTNGSSVPRVPVSLYGVAATTPGGYGSIDITAVTGTCRPAVDSGEPFGTYRPAVKIVVGGTVGTTGITYKVSDEEDPDWTTVPTRRLGTATSITAPNTGAGFVLAPASATVSALYTKVTLLQTTLTGAGHFVIVSGGTAVHAAADSAGDAALAAIPAATTDATCVALFNACKSYLATHVASAVFHTGADATAIAALALIPTAANVADVDLYLDNLIAAYAAHAANTTGVHGSADATNTITAYTPIPGALVAGDIWHVRTTAPQPSAADVDAAFVAIANSTRYHGIVALAFDMTPGLVAHVSTGLNALKLRGKIAWAVGHTRIPNAGEGDSTWVDSISAAYPQGTTDEPRLVLVAHYGPETDARTTAVRVRHGFAQFLADVVRVPINAPPDCPADQPAVGMRLYTSGDVQVGHDEGPRGAATGLSDNVSGNRFVAYAAAKDPLLGNVAFVQVPWTLYGATDTIRTMMQLRVSCSMQRSAFSAATEQGGALFDYTLPDENIPGDTHKLTDVSRNMIHGVIYAALAERFANLIQNADDADPETGLVWVDPVVTVSPGNLLGVKYELRVLFKGVLLTIAGLLVVKE